MTKKNDNEITKIEEGALAPAADDAMLAQFGMMEGMSSEDIEMPEIILFQNQNEDKVGMGHAKGSWVNGITKQAITDSDRVIPLHVRPSVVVWDEMAKAEGIEWPVFVAKRAEDVPAEIRDNQETVEVDGEISPRYAIDIGYDVFVLLNDEPTPYLIKCYRTSKRGAKQLNTILMGRLMSGKGPGVFMLANTSRQTVKKGRKVTYYNPRFVLTDEPMTRQQADTALALIPSLRQDPQYGWLIDRADSSTSSDNAIDADNPFDA